MLRPTAATSLGLVVVVSILLFGSYASAVTLTAQAGCPTISRTLSRGATGTDVTALQQFLITQGVLSADSATGYFGSLTEKGVQTIQKTRNIVTSGTAATTGFGFVGPKTRTLITSLCSGSVSPSAVKAHVVPKLRNPNCPQVPLPTGKSCTGKWKEVRDTIKGCTASWKCST
ncbi:MAG: hypothetical protein A2854_00710 [Parcubacteria group bacterium RIFCSPHIGHO2_01_FULL_56_18]|nr:MAG: hypothetical protein A2854_00710 [Parcubacteria group bacterium RIFCSPHIGHO2_01_FULL_56_18]